MGVLKTRTPFEPGNGNLEIPSNMNTKRIRKQAWAVALILLASTTVHAQSRYVAGDIVDDFTLTDRTTGNPVRLSDFAGSIVFLEWFAHWCPFCVAAAPQVDAGIVDHYRNQGGNPAGIPVVHIALNLQSDSQARDRTATTTFVQRYGFDPVLQDTQRVLARRFADSGQPIFAIINGVTNSPNARPWELLYTLQNYGSTQSPIQQFRTAIDRVQAAPPGVPALRIPQDRPATPGVLRIELEAEAQANFGIEVSDDLLRWTPHATLPKGTRTLDLQLGTGTESSRFVRLTPVP
jgi:thiol-disulfide isomerase/thioredoxin